MFYILFSIEVDYNEKVENTNLFNFDPEVGIAKQHFDNVIKIVSDHIKGLYIFFQNTKYMEWLRLYYMYQMELFEKLKYFIMVDLDEAVIGKIESKLIQVYDMLRT